MKKKIKGYKVFKNDWTCNGFQYVVGETVEMKEKPELCKKGFHFCTNLADCFKYYSTDPNNKIAEVEAIGDITEIKNECSKMATNKIKIIKEIDRQESYKIGNQGQACTGYGNTGNRNTGNRNTGDWNTGDRNTGGWNTCDYESGFFNTEQSDYIRIFHKKCKSTVWEKADKPDFLYFNLTEWVNESDMSVPEKNSNPEYKTTGGYLKKYDYKEAFIKSFNKASKSDVKLLLGLPNFNYKVFEDISGISKKMITAKLNEKS